MVKPCTKCKLCSDCEKDLKKRRRIHELIALAGN